MTTTTATDSVLVDINGNLRTEDALFQVSEVFVGDTKGIVVMYVELKEVGHLFETVQDVVDYYGHFDGVTLEDSISSDPRVKIAAEVFASYSEALAFIAEVIND